MGVRFPGEADDYRQARERLLESEIELPPLNVVQRDGEEIRHLRASELMWAPADPGQRPRHVDTIEPLWNLFDLTGEGRPQDRDEQPAY